MGVSARNCCCLLPFFRGQALTSLSAHLLGSLCKQVYCVWGGRGLRLLFVRTTLSCKDKVSIVACRECWAEGCLSLRTDKPWWSTAFNCVLSPGSLNGVEGGTQTSVCCTPCNKVGQLCLPSSTVLAAL